MVGVRADLRVGAHRESARRAPCGGQLRLAGGRHACRPYSRGARRQCETMLHLARWELSSIGRVLDRFVIDDSAQQTPTRPGMGPLVTVGGLHVRGKALRELESALENL